MSGVCGSFKADDLVRSLKLEQTIFGKPSFTQEAATKASLVIAHKKTIDHFQRDNS